MPTTADPDDTADDTADELVESAEQEAADAAGESSGEPVEEPALDALGAHGMAALHGTRREEVLHRTVIQLVHG